jgi:hypothetical protein
MVHLKRDEEITPRILLTAGDSSDRDSCLVKDSSSRLNLKVHQEILQDSTDWGVIEAGQPLFKKSPKLLSAR